MKNQVASVVKFAATRSLTWRGMDRVGYKVLSDLSDPQDDSPGEKPGVESIVLSLEGGRATVKYDPSVTAPDIIAGQIVLFLLNQ